MSIPYPPPAPDLDGTAVDNGMTRRAAEATARSAAKAPRDEGGAA